MAQEPSVNIPQIVMIDLDDLYVPEWNPRKFVDPVELDELAAFLEKGGVTERILIWKGNGQAPYAIISGQRRALAHRKLGRTRIEAEIMDISLEAAQVLAQTSNQGVQPYWLDRYEGWEAMMRWNDWGQVDLEAKIGRSQALISRGMTLLSVLNPASRALIRQVLAKTAPSPSSPVQNYQSLINQAGPKDENYQTLIKPTGPLVDITPQKAKSKPIVENVAYQLTALLDNRPQEEAQTLAEGVLKVIIDRRMTAPQAAEAVKKHLAPKPAGQEAAASSEPAPSKPVARKKAEPPVEPSSPEKAETPAPTHTSKSSPAEPSLALEALAGISVVHQIQSKIKKGEKPSTGSILILAAYRLWQAVAWLVKHAWKLVKPIGKTVLKLAKDAVKFTLKALGRTVYNLVRALFLLALLAVCVWLAYDIWVKGLHPHQAVKEIGETLWEWAVLIWKQG